MKSSPFILIFGIIIVLGSLVGVSIYQDNITPGQQILTDTAQAVLDGGNDECNTAQDCIDQGLPASGYCSQAYKCQNPAGTNSICVWANGYPDACPTPPPPPPGECRVANSSAQCGDCSDNDSDGGCDYDPQGLCSGQSSIKADLQCDSNDDPNESVTDGGTYYPRINVYTNYYPANAQSLRFDVGKVSGKAGGSTPVGCTIGQNGSCGANFARNPSADYCTDGCTVQWYAWRYTTGAAFGNGDYRITVQNFPAGLTAIIINNVTGNINDDTEYAGSDQNIELDWTIEFQASILVDLKCNSGSGPAQSCTVPKNGTVGLSWTSTNASSCTALAGPWLGVVPSARGISQDDPPAETSDSITETSTFRLSCFGIVNGLPGSKYDDVLVTRTNLNPVPTNVAATMPNYCAIGAGNLGGQTITWTYTDADVPGDPQASFAIQRYRWNATGGSWTRDDGPGAGGNPDGFVGNQVVQNNQQGSYTLPNNNSTDTNPTDANPAPYYLFKVKVTDSEGGTNAVAVNMEECNGTRCHTPCPYVPVSNPSCWQLPADAYPIPSVSVSPNPPNFAAAPGTLTFNGVNETYSRCFAGCLPTGPAPQRWTYTFGPGTTPLYAKSGTHVYTSNGLYPGSLTIVDINGNTCPAFNFSVQVGPTPTPLNLPKWKEVRPK